MANVVRFSLAFVTAAVLCTACSDAPRQSAPVAAPAAGQGGMKAYVDPQTGELTDHAPETLPREKPPAMDAERAPAQLEEHDAPGGGKMIDLQGRFKAQSDADER
jgi:hypothetical protein